MNEIKEEIVIDGKTYYKMKRGIPVNPATDIHNGVAWYIRDARKRESQ